MLKLLKDNIEVVKLYAVRSDDNNLPVIEELHMFEDFDEYGSKIYKSIKPIKYKNNLYPYDRLSYYGYIKYQSVSDCYSKGYIFHTRCDAVRRIELLLEKKVFKMEQVVSEVASWKSRLDLLKY